VGVPEKIDNLLQLGLGFVNARHILEGHLGLSTLAELCPSFAKGKRPALASHLHLPHEKNPDADEQKHREPGNKEGEVPGGPLRLLHRDIHPVLAEHGNQLGIGRDDCGEGSAILVGAQDFLPLNGHPADVPGLNAGPELAVGLLAVLALRLVKNIEKQNHGQADDQPHTQILVKGIQRILLNIDNWMLFLRTVIIKK